ncbi:hypothetical protein GE09DRAFT_1222859 [Coniochaeta sp. 2T2.1]|nr:hypothetical protein GE09DRAFT_1222859 [Coniochaeta sp. 2T2.1]
MSSQLGSPEGGTAATPPLHSEKCPEEVLDGFEDILSVTTTHFSTFEIQHDVQEDLERNPRLKARFEDFKAGLLEEQETRYNKLLAKCYGLPEDWEQNAAPSVANDETAAIEQQEDGEATLVQQPQDQHPQQQHPIPTDGPKQARFQDNEKVHHDSQSIEHDGDDQSSGPVRAPDNKENVPMTAPVAKHDNQSDFISLPGMEGVLVDGQIHASLIAPPHPGMDRLVFRQPSLGRVKACYLYTTVGTDCRIRLPTDTDVIVPYTRDNLKRLWCLYEHIKQRKKVLFALWRDETTGRYSKDALPKQAYEPDTRVTAKMRNLLEEDVPDHQWTLDTVVPVRGRNGGIINSQDDQQAPRQISLLQWRRDGPGNPPLVKEAFWRPAKPLLPGAEASDDIVVPESEITLQRLWSLFNQVVVENDLIDHSSLIAARLRKAKRFPNKRPDDDADPGEGPSAKRVRTETITID